MSSTDGTIDLKYVLSPAPNWAREEFDSFGAAQDSMFAFVQANPDTVVQDGGIDTPKLRYSWHAVRNDQVVKTWQILIQDFRNKIPFQPSKYPGVSFKDRNLLIARLAEFQLKVGEKKWDQRFVKLAQHISEWSKDPSTKVGCVVVGPSGEIRSTGFNGFPRGATDTVERLQNREIKYQLICHAEENAILNASIAGVSLKGCTAYVTWPPCVRCARGLIQAQIKIVAYPAGLEIPDRWKDDFHMSQALLRECEIRINEVSL